MQTPKGRIASSEVFRKVSPLAIRQLKTTGLDSDFASALSQGRTPKDKSPKVGVRRSPRNPATEKKRPSKVSELESQISVLQEELKKANEQFTASDMEEASSIRCGGVQEAAVCHVSKQEESLKQLLQLFVGEKDRTGLNTVGAASLIEIQRLKVQLEVATNSTVAELADVELQTVKGNLMNAHSLVENMKSQLRESKGSEVQARALTGEALVQLETAKKSVETLRTDGMKAIEAYNGLVAELERSRIRVKFLEELVCKLKDGIQNSGRDKSHESVESERPEEVDLRAEISSLKAEVGRLQSVLELKKNSSSQRESAVETKLKKLNESATNFRTSLMEKETELQCILDENSMLKSQLERMESERGRLKEKMVVELEHTRESEKEALLKLGLAIEEADKSSKKVARVTEQLEAAQAANSEMEAELRRLKVQSDQWRKAAEAAAAMLSVGNNGKFMDRTASLDNHYNPVRGKLSPFDEDMDDDMKKRNGSMLKKIGVLWKKPQK